MLYKKLKQIVGEENVLTTTEGAGREALTDATSSRGISGNAELLVRPGSTEETRQVVEWAYRNDAAITPRGGGTGYAGGAVPDGGIVVDLGRMTEVRSFDPGLWRIEVEAGVLTATLQRLARENGLLFPPDPGAAEQSTIGGNIATNAGGPHALKYGSTGSWVTGIEAVVPPGEVINVGGAFRKDVAGYDLRRLLIGSEGTLGLVTAAWIRLIPAPQEVRPVAAFYPNTEAGCAGVKSVLENGLRAAALEYFDGMVIDITATTFPAPVPEDAGFLVIGEVDGSTVEIDSLTGELAEALGEGALSVHRFDDDSATRDLWNWRDSVSLAVAAREGGKVSEDIVVPLDRLEEAIEETKRIGVEHGLPACSWGHAGDGNLHSSFLVDLSDSEALERAETAARELFELAIRFDGTITGEHGVGTVKGGYLERQWDARAVELHEEIKRVFDPKGLLNPDKKLARVEARAQH